MAEPSLDWASIWSAVAVVIGMLTLIGVVYAVVGYYRDHPKRQLEYTVKSFRMVQTAPRAMLEVKVNGMAVADPHLVQFRMSSNSRADIPSSAFDAGNSLNIRVSPGGAAVLGDLTREAIEVNSRVGDDWEWAEFEIPPQLIRKGANLSFDFISNGPPNMTVTSPLVDVPVHNATLRPKWGEYIRSIFTIMAGLLGEFFLIAAPLLGVESSMPLGLTVVVATACLIMLWDGLASLIRALRWRGKG